MQSTKVCFLVESFSGGVFNLIKDAIKTLQDEYGLEFTFCIIYSVRADTPDLFEQHFDGVEFIHVQMGSSAFKKSDLGVILKLRHLFLKQDVIHMHSSRAGFLGRLALATLRIRPRSYYSPHGFAFLRMDFSSAKRWLIWCVEYVLSKISGTGLIASGQTEYNLALKISKHTFLVTNGIHVPDHFSNTRVPIGKPLSPDFFRVVGSGRNCMQKDPDFFVCVAKQFKDKFIDFTWIGDLNNADYATGWISRDEVFNHLNSGDIYLATSLWEGLPLNGLEAMHLKLPLLVRRTSSFVDLVDHGVNGYIFDTVSDAVSHIKYLSDNPSLVVSMGESSKKIVLSKFGIENYLNLATLYRV
ncbi:glycosyltransferase [Porticoccaceae bacterium]|nr:glycosyltransferase [Porticoccaceae bacterium]